MLVGILAVWIGLGAILTALVLYWVAMLRSLRAEAAPTPEPNGKGGNGNNGHGKRGGRHAPVPGERGLPARVRGPLLLARRAFYLPCGCVALGAAVLETRNLTRRYDVYYVWE